MKITDWRSMSANIATPKTKNLVATTKNDRYIVMKKKLDDTEDEKENQLACEKEVGTNLFDDYKLLCFRI